MLNNYWKIAIRYMGRHKTYSFINIAGLSVGLAVSLLIGLWIYDEGSLLLGAREVQAGAMPMADFWTAYSPGMFWIVASLLRIFGEGIATGVATFETAAPDWRRWNATHRKEGRLVARLEGCECAIDPGLARAFARRHAAPALP